MRKWKNQGGEEVIVPLSWDPDRISAEGKKHLGLE
jgi:hypothetical protein